MRSSNPVLSRLQQTVTADRRGQAGYGQQTAYAPYGQPPVISPVDASRSMTLDDVIVRTIFLVGVVVITAAASWILITSPGATALAMIGSSLVGLVLALVISFRRVFNPVVISLYSITQGVWLGVVSRVFEHAYPGIVIQAVGGTLAVFFGMAALYKFRVIRATPRFGRWLLGALIGVVGLSLFNLVLSLFGHNPGLVFYGTGQHAGPLAIVFSLVCIGIGALTFILDFDSVEQGVKYGMPERFAWYCAFGLVVGLVFLYWQILRLLGYLRN